MKHITDSYKDDAHKWVVFCKVCGVEEPLLDLNGDCPGKLVRLADLQKEADKMIPVGKL